ncbi:hypothetical protein H6P81_008188 [Aristolochia fimbriata]|uniref:RRM domain-containing protein n=1 Tax=Aristolochia fimbriata TaxID=158543 RepID=A0AAV7F3J3_ARIFI|nr:hypothetical protein H6P81_008188 [Aristolochia fimbriata]
MYSDASSCCDPKARRQTPDQSSLPQESSNPKDTEEITMSRICVKNLPRYIAEDRVRDFFSQKGEITDAKIMRTKDGMSRQFAFVGFRSEKEAEEAIKFFNNSYLDTCRITCEVARKIGDPDIPRPWSRHSAQKQSAQNANKEKVSVTKGTGIPYDNAKKPKQGGANSDLKLQEFLEVMQPRIKTKLWSNDTLGAPTTTGNDKGRENQPKKIQDKQPALAGDDVDQANPRDISSVRQNGSEETMMKQPQHKLALDEVLSDMDYFRSRVKKNWSDSESSDEDSQNDGQKGNHVEKEEDQEENVEEIDHPENVEGIDHPENVGAENNENENPSQDLEEERDQDLEITRLFVRNLPYTANEEDLMELFGQYGDVSEVHIVLDKDTKRSKGIGYVLFSLPESAVRALRELDNSIFQGRLLHVMPAKQPPSSEKLESKSAIKTFKEQRAEQKKASEVGGDTRAWNSLFVRSDTVAENIARKYGVSKSDLLDREADDLAVRIALGETQVIAETKKGLMNAGVNVEALENFAAGRTKDLKRSNHVILVKNLPISSSEGDLFKMFSKFGSLDKIILPSTKTLALVVFLEAAEARAAFKGLAYKRYRDAPLYLEWASSDILIPGSKGEAEPRKNSVVGEKEVKKILLEQSVQGIPEEDLDPDRVESRSVFVKNLNFKTTDDSLRRHFAENLREGKLCSVKVKKHMKNGKNVSMGFGFLEFDSVETATNVCRDIQGTVLDGHALILQLCRTKKEGEALKKSEKDKSTTKLIVRNVAFEATEKDLRQLFSPFGQIKSLRLPMKMGGHRGFAFVEYVTKQEAQNALEALSSTHLYGRHLVLERAKEGESLEELRARTAAQFADEQGGFQSTSKLSKKRKHMSIVDEGNMKFERITEFS